MIPRIVITAGEPAGIGPDIVIMAAQQTWPAELICIADIQLLGERANALGLPLKLFPWSATNNLTTHEPGTLKYIHIPLVTRVSPGKLDPDNANYVLNSLTQAADLCLASSVYAMVTAPVHKSVINDAGIPFSGHTEFLQQYCGADNVVMLLAATDLRIALATTHLPLVDVPAAITLDSLSRVILTLEKDLKAKFGISEPRITVLGLNPHAGEGGHLGREEEDIIRPALEQLRAKGLIIEGPLPADTAFNPKIRARTDAYLAMYHDQGLPVLKYAAFGQAVNITLGLPLLRTSVDHGTALTLAGTGQAHPGSLQAALQLVIQLAKT